MFLVVAGLSLLFSCSCSVFLVFLFLFVVLFHASCRSFCCFIVLAVRSLVPFPVCLFEVVLCLFCFVVVRWCNLGCRLSCFGIS